MRFVISDLPMNGNEKTLSALDSIISRVEDAVHELEILDADKLDASNWYRSSRYDRQRLLEEIAAEALRNPPPPDGPHSQKMQVRSVAEAALAKLVAYTPLDILMENAVSDKALVSAAIGVFGRSTTKALCFGDQSKLAPPPVRFESWGGAGELKKLIVAKLAEATAKGIAPRLVVVADSDGEWAGDVKQHALDIRTLCAQNSVICPPLLQRTAENYIPDEVWEARSAEPNGAVLKPIVEALKRLSPEQRDHVRLEQSGTPPWDNAKPQVDALYANVPFDDWKTLTKAALKGKGDTMWIHSLTQYKELLNAQVFRGRDRSGDLATLVQHIENAL